MLSYWIILFRTLLAVLIGGLIGMERQTKHRPAGFRTHILVCLGASTIMVLSALMFEHYYQNYNILSDPARLGAQVISGVGFLGAGTIIHSGSNVRGLTTAASLWAVAAIGLVIGAGFYSLAITVAIVLYLTLFIFNRISKKFAITGNILELMIDLANKPKALGAINLALAKANCKILDMEFFSNNSDSTGDDEITDSDVITIRIVVKLQQSINYYEIINSINAINGVINVERV